MKPKKNMFYWSLCFFQVTILHTYVAYAEQEMLPVSQIRQTDKELFAETDASLQEKLETKAKLDTAGLDDKEKQKPKTFREKIKGVIERARAKKGKQVQKPAQYELRAKPMEKRNFEFHLTGGLAFEAMYDVRQVNGDRFDEFIFAPESQKIDSRGLDINAKDQFNMMGVRVCTGMHIKGPDLWGGKTTAVIEGEFNGLKDSLSPNTARLFRLERGHANVEWENTKLLFGHYYHPLVLDEMFPETISRGQGRVYDPFDYAPQIKLRHRVRQFEFVFAIAKKFYSEAARWAAVPDLFAQLNLHTKGHIFGMGINYHAEVPRLFSQIPPTETHLTPVTATYKTTEQVDSLYPFVFAKIHAEPFDIRFRCTYAENASVYDLIGAYGVRYRNDATDERMYENIRTLAVWADIIYRKWQKLELAVFVGFSKNLGAAKNIIKGYTYENITDYLPLIAVPDSAVDLDYTFICAPRLRVRFGEFSLGAELEYTRAAYARPINEKGWEDDFDDTGAVICSKPVSNFRFLLATFYHFDYIPFSYK